MIPDRYFTPKKLLLTVSLFIFSFITTKAQGDANAAGKAIFQNKCASCHIMGKDATGPNLQGVLGRWESIDQIKVWILDWEKAVAAGYPEAVHIKDFSPAQMQKFAGQISDKELTDVITYVDGWTPPAAPTSTTANGQPQEDGRGALIFGIISLIMAIIALILMQVNSNLKKLSDDTEGILRPEPVPFYRNKAYIALFSIVLFIVGGFYVTRGAIDLGRQRKYQPEQPIFYSHKVHAGINQINCLYCHGAAMESKHAAIPSVNVCMNCHKTINEYAKGPKLVREDGTEVNGTAEIQKLYAYAGFDPKNANAWDPSKAKPIAWTKIHNLPDHVYFNHSQHIRAGKVQCQSCHGEITAMDEVYQFSELSMGWCINCHRQTKVDFYKVDTSGKATGNKFYSVYDKFMTPDTVWDAGKIKEIHKAKLDSVTVMNIGGLECQKCHY
jgi:mono/diheme cytochrome c family protein